MPNHSIRSDVGGVNEPAPRWTQGHVVVCSCFKRVQCRNYSGKIPPQTNLLWIGCLRHQPGLVLGSQFAKSSQKRPNWFVTRLYFLVHLGAYFADWISWIHLINFLISFWWFCFHGLKMAWGCGHYKHYFLAVAQCNLTALLGSMASYCGSRST